MGEIRIIELSAPVVEVTLLEDRAHVVRRGAAELPAGHVRLVVADVAPVLGDKTLAARVHGPAGAVKIHDVRAVRRSKALRESRPEEVRKLEAELDGALRELERLEHGREALDGQLTGLDRVEELAIAEVAEDAAWDRDSRGAAGELLGKLDSRVGTLQAEVSELAGRIKLQKRAVRDLEGRLEQVRNPATRIGASLEADVEAAAAGSCEVQFDYVVPGACWRPWHTAELVEGGEPLVRMRSEACVWQNTGEDWKSTRLLFSTQRPSLGTEPPELSSDVLSARKKSPVVEVAVREQEIQTSGLGGGGAGAAAEEMPGIDDGGEALALKSSDPADVPSDGRPCRVPYASFEAKAQAGRVLMPELAGCAFFRTVQVNAGTMPLLAGPVDLLRRGGFVGRTKTKFVAPGERFTLGWGAEGALRVSREVEQKDEEPGLMSSWRTERRRLTLRLSNLGAEELAVEVTERVPVSEIEQVEIAVDARETTGGRTPDAEGFVKWDLRLKPFGQETLRLAYAVKKRKDVKG